MDKEAQLKEIFDRNIIEEILPDKESLLKCILENKPLHFYLGLDPTAEEIHLGHAQNLMLLEDFRKLGIKVTILVGDFTAKIGDPTGKDKKRKELSNAEIKKYISKWQRQFTPFINTGFMNGARIRHNSEWLSKLSLKKLFPVIKQITVGNLIERSMFQNRIKEGKPIHLNEFLYPILQGYDSVHMRVDGEICGTDQIFNALIGRDLVKKEYDKEKFVIATRLIEDTTTGKLMSKSEGTGVFVKCGKEHASDMYGKIMSLSDGMMRRLFFGITRIPINEVENILLDHPLKAKHRLAFDVVARVYGSQEALKAENNFQKQFQEKGIPDDVRKHSLSESQNIVALMVSFDLASSNSDARRKIEGGAVKVDDMKITDVKFIVDPTKHSIIRSGRQIVQIEE